MTVAEQIAEQTSEPKRIDLSIFQSPAKLKLILGLFLVLITLGVYNSISRAPFLNYDDDYYVIQNFHVRAGLSWNTLAWAFHSTELSNWHPLTWLSHALDVRLFGMNPAGHHYVNVLLHAANALLLFLFLYRGTGALWRSFLVAAFFAVHPVNVESVAWISERKSVLSMLFFLLGLIAYLRYTRRPSIPKYLPVAGCFALGLMAKPQVITFPFVLLLLDYWPLRRLEAAGEPEGLPLFASRHPFTFLLLEKVPLFAMCVGSAIITLKAQSTAINLVTPLWVRLGNAVLAYVKYISEGFCPYHLAPLYPHPGLLLNVHLAIMAAVLLVAITALASVLHIPYLWVGWFWFLGTLIPMIGLVQVGGMEMADRYAYIPFIGLFILVVWGSADLLERWRVSRSIAAVASCIVLLALSAACQHQIGYWSDNLTLWTHTLEVTENNYLAEDSAAMALIVQGRPKDAISHFERAVTINPKDPLGNLNLGIYEQQAGNYSLAIARYRIVFRVTTNPQLLTSALAKCGSALYALKEFEQSRQSYEAALRYFPENSQAFLGLGLLAQRSGALQQATQNYMRSVEFQPTDVGYLLLAQALEKNGQADAANAAQVKADGISPDIDHARRSVAQLLSE